MTHYILYQYPLRACSTVTVNAMLELGLEFEDRVIDILKGEQKDSSYLKVNPQGKVPALSVDGEVLVENAAILLYLDSLIPNRLFPEANTPLEKAIMNSDLVWCTATMHTTIRQVRMPMRYTDGDVSGVREKGISETKAMLDVIEARLADNRWWYGDAWSILDVYINWGVTTAASTDLLPLDSYPAIKSHMHRVGDRPSFQAAMARQIAAKNNSGLVFPGEVPWKTDFS